MLSALLGTAVESPGVTGPADRSAPVNSPAAVPVIAGASAASAPEPPKLEKYEFDPKGRVTRIRGRAGAGSTVRLSIDGESFAAKTDASGMWVRELDAPLSDEPHSIRAFAEDAAGNRSADSDFHSVTCRSVQNVFTDDIVTLSAEDGHSIRIERSGSYEFKIAVDVPGPLSVKARLRKNTLYAGPEPRIVLSGLGIDGRAGASAAMPPDRYDTWEELEATGEAKENGIVTLRVDSFGELDSSKVWVDDISVGQ